MFTLFLDTGCRVGEIIGLRREACDFKQRVIERMYKGCNKQEPEQAHAEGRQLMLIRHFFVHNLRHTFAHDSARMKRT